MAIQTIGIVANTAKDKALEYTIRLRDWCLAQGLHVFFHEQIAAKIGAAEGYETKVLAGKVDLLAVFGGDGTMLRTARAVREFPVPIIGINLGLFGYLTEVNLNEMIDAFEVILQGNYQTERRMMLDVSIQAAGDSSKARTVLNDAVINRGNLSRIVDLETFVDDCYLTTFKADGLIVSTPTGSTAYSLSAGGPIVFPQHDSIIVNPICPHTLTNRPIILPGRAQLKVVLRSKGEGATLTFDGQVSVLMKSGDAMIITKSRYETLLVCSPHRDYLEILRSKLGWGGLPTILRKP
ncbi:MAG: NAD kinase [Syntrophus sp. SKADARSKE-3]|nr:NAD kinase [Syntrophus sp. SKADARSKE-3]